MSVLLKIKNFVWSKWFLINFGALILVYIIIILSVQGCLSSKTHFGQKIEVPNLVGKNQNNIENIMASSPLKYEILDSIYDPAKIEGTIIEQDPLPTAKSMIFVKEGRTIKLRVSKRTQLVEVPSLVNKSQRFAEGVLRNRGFKYRLEYKPSQESHGAVMEQLYKGKPIKEGVKIPIGSTIKLIVGRHEVGVPLPLPNLYGLTIVEARDRVNSMLNMEFMIVCPDCLTKNDSLVARVKSQSPEFSEESVVASGGSITVYASKEFNNPQ